ncbi:MAG: hypothetical protein HKP58_01475 [Desulfatitalea sp.]|nr:hypothetical protein [Desulfatitalea sp.]NNJ99057.1 hypothetical protein [Desulfatitalea sp.]
MANPIIGKHISGKMSTAVSLAMAGTLVPILLIFFIAADQMFRSSHQDRSAVAWMARLDLSSPALWPAGTAERLSAELPMAVDLRMDPLFDWRPHGRQMVLPAPCHQGQAP